MSDTLYRGYDPAQLDAQYNPRAAAPLFQLLVDRWAADSEATVRSFANRLDLAYGPSAAERIDVFPAKYPKAPVQVFFHGGYWRAMDKATNRFLARGFVPAGVTTVVANYGLCPAVSMDELVRQTRACIAWIWKNAASFGGDPDRIYISGHSAGGHIVCMALATDWPALGAPPGVVKGVCAISGLYDLEPIQRIFVNKELRMTPEQALRNSPLLHMPKSPTPLIMAVGALESDEWRRQTSDYVAAFRSRGWPVEHIVVPGHDHYSILGPFEDPSHALHDAVLRQMKLG
ncbi:MAG: alpha/beta hydrolase [Candidatus Odyssella sp.]|nr:alpha/beta hydrolase [Candidatus Odyssella sp.]